MVRPNFTITEANAADVAAICRRLDGLPLAIELAASRARLLAPRALLARLGDSLGLDAGAAGRPSRQQTLRNTIAWSYELLDAELAGVFRRMGVFAGGCDLDALAAIASQSGRPAGADPLQLAAGLLDVSLITVAEGADSEPRVGMLEAIRQYALDQLERSGNLDDARRRHAGYFCAFAEQVAAQLRGPAHLASLNRLETGARQPARRADLVAGTPRPRCDRRRRADSDRPAARPGTGPVLVPARSRGRGAAVARTGDRASRSGRRRTAGEDRSQARDAAAPAGRTRRGDPRP